MDPFCLRIKRFFRRSKSLHEEVVEMMLYEGVFQASKQTSIFPQLKELKVKKKFLN